MTQDHQAPAPPAEDPGTGPDEMLSVDDFRLDAAQWQAVAIQQTIHAIITGADIQIKALQAFIELGLPQLLDTEFLAADEITARCDAEPALMRRFLYDMHAYNFLEADDDGRYGLTALGHALRPGQGTMWAALRVITSPLWQRAGDDLAQTIRRGYPDVLGGEATPYPLVARDPALGPMFDLFMSGRAAGPAATLAARDYTGVRTVADLGGGDGTVLASVLTAHPHLKGVLAERPDVAERARHRLAEHGLADRVRITHDDIFSGVCPAADRILLCSVLHNWEDDENIMLLCGVRDALEEAGPHAELWCVETLLPEPGQWTNGIDLDLRMMTLFAGGRERSLAQHTKLLQQAGLTLRTADHLPGDYTLLVASARG